MSEQYGNGLYQTWRYSGPMQRLAQIKIGDGGNPGGLGGFFNRSYSYDNSGNVSAIGDNAVCQQQNFQYDAQNRLTSAATQDNCGQTRPDDYSQNITYDQVGNIKHKDGVGDYSYANGHAHQVSQAGPTPISYDANGNASNGPNHIFNWNYDNQLASSSNQNDTESYAYDADGERVTRAVSGGTTTYFVGGGMWEEDSTGTTRSLYQFGGAVIAQRSVVPAGVQQPYYAQPVNLLAAAGPTQAKATSTPLVGQKEQAYLPCANAVEKANIVCGATTPRFATPTPTPVPQPTVHLIYLHGDHLGSASAATDTNGSLVSQQNFDPWGNLRAGTTGTISQTDVNYTGQVKDGSGLLYYHARYYDPYVSRFVSPDSVVPGSASGAGGGAATLGVDSKTELRALTVDFHEPGFAKELGKEDRFTAQAGFRFQLDNQELQRAKISCGPLNSQLAKSCYLKQVVPGFGSV